MSSVNLRATFLLPYFLLFLACPGPVLSPVSAHSQGSGANTVSVTPGAKPADVPVVWKQLVGIYNSGTKDIIILERDSRLQWHEPSGEEAPISAGSHDKFSIRRRGRKNEPLTMHRNGMGSITEISLGDKVYKRTDAGSDPAHYFHVTPLKPVTELRAEALRATPPEEPGPFRKPNLVELTTLDGGFRLDIRYAQSDNFLGTPVYTQGRAFLQRPAAEALRRALKKLAPLGYGLLVHDAYRPWYVTNIFWEATPPRDHNFVADPQKGSKHNRGCAVDITLYDAATAMAIEMPGLYDEMSPRSFPTFPGGTSLERWHRDLLRWAIESEGFTVDVNEWWHFDYKDWKQYPILNVPFENLGTLMAPGNARL
jgi:D-alanyl-D-alanine dipeptidase